MKKRVGALRTPVGDKNLCDVLLSAGVSLLGITVLVGGLFTLLSVVAHGGERLPVEIIMALGLAIGLGGMVATSYSTASDR